MEEVEDDENPTTEVLKDVEIVMMPESEFLTLSERGKMEELKRQFSQKQTKPQKQNMKKPQKAYHNNKADPKRARQSRGIDITGECEPTSSKVKVEDLITNKDEIEHEPLPQTRLWDRPVPPPDLQWTGDLRLPTELNDVTAAMWNYNWPQFVDKKESYQEPDPHEVSKPKVFIAKMHDERPKGKREPKQRFSLPTVDESMEAIDRLKQKYQRPIRKDEPSKIPIRPSRKGKEHMSDSEENLANLRQGWHDEFHEILQGTPERLPPLRVVNHEIQLIDPDKQYRYHLPRCPATVRKEFQHKLNRYVNAEWWVPATGTQAPPLLCVPKKDGRLRTVVDARQRNDNTVKDVTPLPDQEVIREDVARAKYKSKVDLADAYEQVHVEPNDVPKTLFATIMGTYYSNVVQQGDCNAPATFQRLMTAIFRDVIGKFMHVYLDDIFIFSETVEEHQEHLRVIFERLRDNHLFLKWKKCELYAKKVECLGHIIDEDGIHPDADKLDCIRNWRTPRNYNDVQRFTGLVNYVSNFLPNVTAFTGPLMAMNQNGALFFWRPIHAKCFEMIKVICDKTPVLKPIDYGSDKPIWVVCDASKTGVGAMYGQGDDWISCRPAGFMSRKFTTAQQNYAVHEMETLAILEALQKWEDKILGRKIHVITDHKALEFFKTQTRLSNRQMQWTEYMSRFDFDITYVKGEFNKVADCLSRYYESDTPADTHEFHEYVQTDRKLDPEGEDLPSSRVAEVKERIVEIRVMRTKDNEKRHCRPPIEIVTTRDIEAEKLRPPLRTPEPPLNTPDITLADSLGKTADKETRPLRKGGQ